MFSSLRGFPPVTHFNEIYLAAAKKLTSLTFLSADDDDVEKCNTYYCGSMETPKLLIGR